MLREDGMVLDDGTIARLGESRFLMTTTTAQCGQGHAIISSICCRSSGRSCGSS